MRRKQYVNNACQNVLRIEKNAERNMWKHEKICLVLLFVHEDAKKEEILDKCETKYKLIRSLSGCGWLPILVLMKIDLSEKMKI